MNSRKQAHDDVLDPFEIGPDWFTLEFSFLQVLPNNDCSEERRQTIQSTIDRLKLNCAECISARANYYDAYLREEINFGYLEKMAPFVARELIRQGLLKQI